jgi:hypothetical protein
MLWMLMMMNAMDRADRMSPRGRMNVRKEVPQDENRPTGNGSGLGGLILLPALLFGGWMILPLAGLVLSAVIAVIGRVFSGVASVGGVAVGILIGLALFFQLRNRKAAEAEDEGSEEV